MELSTERKNSNQDEFDHLGVKVKLSKCSRGSINLHDAKVRVSWGESNELINNLSGIERLKYKTETSNGITQNIISWEKDSSKLFMRFSPNEETQLACYFTIPANTVCLVEVMVIAPTLSRVAQWQSSEISLPV
jgi:hypothetical protein